MTRTELVTTLTSIALLGLALTALPPGSDAKTLDAQTFRVNASWQGPAAERASLDVATQVGIPIRVQEQNLRLEVVLIDRCRSDRHVAARVRGRAAGPVQLSISTREGVEASERQELGRWALTGERDGPAPLRIDEILTLDSCTPT
ncbi:MAG: hypothetical protein AAF690_07045 [Acidobacteriota bacterium]